MKTIIIAHNYSENSFAYMSYNLAHHLVELGNRVVFISHKPFFYQPQTFQKEKGLLIVCSWPSAKRPTGFKDALWFAKIVLKYKPNVIIGHFVGSNISILVSKIMLMARVTTYSYYHTLSNQILGDSQHDFWKQKLLFFRKKIFYSLFCDQIICPSALAKADLESFFGIKKGIVILNPMQDRFKEKETHPKTPIVVAYLGRLDATKGVLDLIKAFNLFKTKNPTTPVILNIAGTGSQQKEIDYLCKKSQSVQYFGGLEYHQIDAYLQQSNFVIIPSKVDNLPTVGLESLMNARPLLISTATGLCDYLTDSQDCMKFSPNINSMVLLFEKLESINQNQMSQNARATFLKLFGVEKYNNQVSKLIL